MTQHYYAFFEQRQVDWQAAAPIAKTAVTDDMIDAQLTEVLIQLLSVIDDNHVLLHAAPIDLYNPEPSIEEVTLFGHPNDFDSQILPSILNFCQNFDWQNITASSSPSTTQLPSAIYMLESKPRVG